MALQQVAQRFAIAWQIRMLSKPARYATTKTTRALRLQPGAKTDPVGVESGFEGGGSTPRRRPD